MNTTVQAFKDLFASARKRFEYFLEGTIIGFTEDIVARMSALNVSKSNLAEKLRCKPSYITKVLRGSTNFTLASMVKIGIALDSEVEVRLRPNTIDTDWSSVLQSIPTAQKATCDLLSQWPNARRNLSRFCQTTKNISFNEPVQSRISGTHSVAEPSIY